MSKKISINVSGGTSSFHDVVQGENITIGQSSQTIQNLNRAFAEADQAVLREAQRRGEPDDRVSQLKKESEEIIKLLASGKAPEQNIRTRITWIKENFAWAGPILVKVLTAVVPQLAQFF